MTPRRPTPDRTYPHVEAAEAYVRGVLDGTTAACQWARLACERHERDKVAGRWRWSPRHAERVCVFLERLVHIKGEWARRPLKQRLIKLEPWQCFAICSVFGWLREDGTRRYRQAYEEVPRKNAKSTKAAGIGLYMLTADGEEGAEVYSGATTEHQAWEVFGPARMMALKSPDFAAHYQVLIGAEQLTRIDSAAKFEPLIGDPGDGASPSCALVDEYHEHQTARLYDAMQTGMGARRQPLQLVITTAGSNIAGPCYALRDHATRVLLGLVEDEETWACIWTIDDGDDWTDPKVWRKANPNFGVSVMEDFLDARRREAMQRAGRQAIILCKHLNVWSRTHTRWINPMQWDACRVDGLRRLNFAGAPCWIGLDLASKIDMAALVMLFSAGDNRIAAFGRYFLPEATVELPENEHYRTWRAQGLLTVTDGDVIDYDAIEQVIDEVKSQHEIRCVAYDPYQATQFSTRMLAKGVPMVEVGATVKNFSDPMKSLEAAVIAAALEHDGDPVLAWAASNVVAHRDAKDNVYPRKERNENKIDPIVALIMALGRMLVDVDAGIEPSVGWI